MQIITSFIAGEGVRTIQSAATGLTVDMIIACAAIYVVGTRAARYNVVSIIAEESIATGSAHHDIVSGKQRIWPTHREPCGQAGNANLHILNIVSRCAVLDTMYFRNDALGRLAVTRIAEA
ncbi:hypothetical protein ASD39_03635 [Sphingomonas sp. Root50]|nr:hypothetical protein ASD17_02425 [Sphingomonas sp. Root1294]KQY69390.1 hypothetical protein ASD39_03635 [Sphingomonas sp. Root50]KRB89648.1 hypothetical protein ASE22_18545 [Sphingomonas sp. Root720]